MSPGNSFGRVDRVAAMQKPQSMTDALNGTATGSSEALLLGPTKGEEGPPDPAPYDRLPLEWNKKTVKRFKEKLAERDIEAFLVRDPLNIIEFHESCPLETLRLVYYSQTLSSFSSSGERRRGARQWQESQ